MQADASATLHLADEDATSRLGALLAPRLGLGDTLLLEGPIGAGKTHLARAIITTRLAAAGRFEDIPSPTFTLVQTYDDAKTEIWHADLYRLGHPDDVIELGLDDAFASAIVLIEWPDRLGPYQPENALRITLSSSDEGESRGVVLSGSAAKWKARISLVETEMARPQHA